MLGLAPDPAAPRRFMPGHEKKLGGRAPTVGLLVDWLEDEYQNTVMAGAMDAARDRGFNFVAFCGGVLDAPDRNGHARNHCFELATARSVSGLLVMGGTMGNHSGPARLAEYCRRYGDIPRCCIGIALEGTPSVLVDNAAGMREAIEHLLDAHQKRRIFFVRGPDVNEEAEKRYAVFQSVLSERGIRVDPELCHVGNFQPSAGREAMTRALERGLEFDAVIAANDSMAMGALEVLVARGRRVPEDVTLVGFDDVEEARFLDPPLSTVRQPLYDQGKQAVRLLANRMQGAVDGDVVLRTHLVARRSCGCSGSAFSWAPEATAALGFEALFVSRRDLIAAEVVRAAQASFGGLRSGWEGRLLTALLDDVLGRRPTAFLDAYQEALTQAFRLGNPVDAWHEVLSVLRKHTLSGLHGDFPRYRAAEALFQEARLLTSQVVERAQAEKRLRAEHLARKMARAGAALIARFDEQALFAACTEHLPELGIHSAFVVRRVDSEVSELAFGLGAVGAIRAGRRFAAQELLPGDVLPGSPFALIVEPLLLGEDASGYAVFSLGPRNGTVYESLRDQISAALQGARLAQR